MVYHCCHHQGAVQLFMIIAGIKVVVRATVLVRYSIILVLDPSGFQSESKTFCPADDGVVCVSGLWHLRPDTAMTCQTGTLQKISGSSEMLQAGRVILGRWCTCISHKSRM